jgi:hypothetical protein
MKILSCFPSKYLKAADLGDRRITAGMDYVVLEDIGEPDPKPILYFKNCPKGMVLNKTNAKTIMAAYGEETDHWRGKSIVIFAAMVDFKGDTVEALRVKIPAASADQPRVLKKDTRDLYIALQAEMDAAAYSVERLRAWSTTAAARIRQLPADWQLSLSALHLEKIGDLIDGKPLRPAAEMLADRWGDKQGDSLIRGMGPRRDGHGAAQAAEEDHDADGVVWEETGERAADADDLDGIPGFLDRRAAPEQIVPVNGTNGDWYAAMSRRPHA